MGLRYRPEIDGLRALAVASVIMFHARVPGFSNGFLGVDIFFAISGFLITSVILKEYEGSGFSYYSFVVRRARRILPALFVVMIASVPFAYWLMLPDALENFGQSLIAATLSSNNILLWLTTGYWDVAAEYKPLLHTWSLGVEEQFYLIYPFVLLLIVRLRGVATVIGIFALAVASFLFMVQELSRDPSEAFYLLHCRAWQLLIGAVAAVIYSHRSLQANQGLSGLGCLMMTLALLPFPLGDGALPARMLLATFGAAMYLMWADADGHVTWLFTRRSMVFVGTISYSLYLWHQPFFSFLRVGLVDEPNALQLALAAMLSVGVSVLSWRYVEVPFRSRSKVTSKKLWSFVALSTVVLLAVGGLLHTSRGLPQRLNYASAEGEAGSSIAYNERVRKILPSDFNGIDGEWRVLIAGNSFARDFANVLIEAGLHDDLMLFYRDDFTPCAAEWTEMQRKAAESFDLIIFASGYYGNSCLENGVPVIEAMGLSTRFVGPKHFGTNLNPLVRYSSERRADTVLRVPEAVLAANIRQRNFLDYRYVDLISVLSSDGKMIRVADNDGVLLTTDNIHLSKAGAQFISSYLEDLLPDAFILARKARAE
jgi:peptidoglycan/LPS O-acetylase OafA/YrhL